MKNIIIIFLSLTTLILLTVNIYQRHKPYDGYLSKKEISRFEIRNDFKPDPSKRVTQQFFDSLLSDDEITGFNVYLSNSGISRTKEDSLRADYIINYFKPNFELYILDTIQVAPKIKWGIVLKINTENLKLTNKYSDIYREKTIYAVPIQNKYCQQKSIKLAMDLGQMSLNTRISKMHSILLSDSTMISFTEASILSDIVGRPSSIKITKSYYYITLGCLGLFKETTTNKN